MLHVRLQSITYYINCDTHERVRWLTAQFVYAFGCENCPTYYVRTQAWHVCSRLSECVRANTFLHPNSSSQTKAQVPQNIGWGIERICSNNYPVRLVCLARSAGAQSCTRPHFWRVRWGGWLATTVFGCAAAQVCAYVRPCCRVCVPSRLAGHPPIQE